MTRREISRKPPVRKVTDFDSGREERPKLFDTSIIGDPHAAMDFITNILESSTEYSIIAKDLNGKILLWNEGARRLYGFEPGEVVGKMNSSVLNTPEDVKAKLPQKSWTMRLRSGNSKIPSRAGGQTAKFP
jgi:PAS domain-containing protein